MLTIEVCIGSSCYVKGSNQVVQLLKDMISDHQWEEQVILKGAFCMGMCSQGLGIRVNGRPLYGISLHNAKQELTKYITTQLQHE
jgi:NADH:ubiquinone oxidoreductase subunit E